MKGFLSDNSSSVHPKILDSLLRVNEGHVYPYGSDPVTIELEETIKIIFGKKAKTTVVLNGTGANIIALKSVTNSYQGVLSVDSAHINVDECGAFENLTGGKIITVPHENGKLNVRLLEEHLKVKGNMHHNQPSVISISQVTEYGSVYTKAELKAIADYAHDHDLYLHVDGARISNACVSLGISFKEMICDTGVDLLSFGGTKNGMMYGELIISFNPEIDEKLAYIRKQGMQLASKMRYVSAQFLEYLSNDLWKVNANKANEMTAVLYKSLKEFSEIQFMASVDANIIFAYLPPQWVEELSQKHHFYVMDSDQGLIRLVTSFDTEITEIEAFIHDLKIAHARNEVMAY
jgi:threonine aldolase